MEHLGLASHAMANQVITGPPDPSYQLGSIDPTDDDNPLFATNEFRMLYMKVLPCAKRYVHDWTNCPFGHTGEKARRRDPRLYTYTGIACPDMKKTGNCIRGDKCPYAHNVFEYWLHPTRYRTQLCNDGQNCSRKVCFFAHTLDEVRVPKQKPYVSPEALAAASLEAIAEACRTRDPALNEASPGAVQQALSGSLPPVPAQAPALAPGGLYKSYSCPTHVPPINQQVLSGMAGNPVYTAHRPPLQRGGSSAAMAALTNGQDRLQLLAKMQGDGRAQLSTFQPPPPPPGHPPGCAIPSVASSALSATVGCGVSSPRSAESAGISHLPSPATSQVHVENSGNDTELLQSLVSIKQAINSGKLAQDDVMRLLTGLSEGSTGAVQHPGPSASPGPALLCPSPKPSDTSVDNQCHRLGPHGPGLAESAGHASDVAAAEAASGPCKPPVPDFATAAAILSSVPSSNALTDAQELLQNLTLGVSGSPAGSMGPAGIPMAATSGSIWHTASAPVLPAGLDPALLAPHAALASIHPQFMMPTVSEGAPLPDVYNRNYTVVRGMQPSHDDASLQQRAVIEELLQQSAATQSSAAANGQASRQAKLAKASSLTNWLNKLKPDQ